MYRKVLRKHGRDSWIHTVKENLTFEHNNHFNCKIIINIAIEQLQLIQYIPYSEQLIEANLRRLFFFLFLFISFLSNTSYHQVK